MPRGFRTLVRLSGAFALALFLWSPVQSGGSTDTTHTKPVDTTHAKPDSLKHIRPTYAVESPWAHGETCPSGAESAAECWRTSRDLANMDFGFPGTRAFTLSLTNWQTVPVHSPFFPAWKHSPYLNGGLAPLEKFAVTTSGGDAQAIEEIWSPVAPLDTPITRLNWERGPITLNVFDLRLRRMLSDRVYLAMDYFSSSADSQSYDYQFNVHQPYLGGLGFLGQIYGPIDRDSASLVLEGHSHAIQAVAMRPRIGVWLDTNRVVEVYLEHLKNSTNMVLPQGPIVVAGISRPGAVDSLQTLVPGGMSTTSEGVLYAETHHHWTSQWEAGHTAFSASEYRSGDSLTVRSGIDQLQADIFRLRGSIAGTGLWGRPDLRLETRSETWDGDPVLTGSRSQTSGWTDAQDMTLGMHPTLGMLEGSVDAGLGRSSRMDNQVYWLQHYGASANLHLPFGLGVEGGASSRTQDPEWEMLYRNNSARFRYASPALQPRTDMGWRGSVSVAMPHVTLDGGLDFFRSQDAWLPRVLPGPQACADLFDSTYTNMRAQRCTGDSTGTSSSAGSFLGHLPDSLALALRNFGEQRLDAWHMGVALGLGNWTLQLRNRFLFDRTITDAHLAEAREDLSVPARVFKGRLAWKRALVDGKLKLDLAWDWDWFSTRYGWLPDLQGTSRVAKLDEYLILDFQAAMHIKTFTLFFRSMNMNHDRYATELGVHPPGINFRFGVEWLLWN